jgi:hypothetical protein
MSQIIIIPHPDPFVDLIRPYVARAAEALRAGGLKVEHIDLDPYNPRDATIVCEPTPGDVTRRQEAYVWDEFTGWRRGRYLDGRQGVRTRLAEVGHLGGGVLLDARELAYRAANHIAVPRPNYRSAADFRDGLDDTLRGVS